MNESNETERHAEILIEDMQYYLELINEWN